MYRRLSYHLFVLVGFAIVCATAILGQSIGKTEILTLNPNNSWQGAQLVGSSKGKAFSTLFVVTLDQPERRHLCRVQSFAADKLVCSRALGGVQTFLPRQILALLVPGDGKAKLWFALGINGAIGTAIWGTVVFAATCPACAVATGIAAFVCFVVAAGVLAADDQPDRLLYLAPGEHLSRKLGYVQYRQP